MAKKFVELLYVILFALQGAPVFAAYSPSNYAIASYTGSVATGARLAQTTSDGYKSVFTRSDHIMRGKPATIQVMFCAFFGPAEASNGQSTTVKVSLEYPVGTKTAFQFSGSATGTIGTSGGCITSDSLTNPAPDGAQFFVNSLLNNSAGLAVNKNMDPAQGSGGVVSTTVNAVTDSTTSATPTLSSPGVGITPTAILGATTLPTAVLEGDSRAHGLTYVASGGQPDTGSLAASIGAASLPYIDLGWSGEKAADWNTGHTWRALIANTYGTVNVLEYGFNDANIDQVSLSTIQSRLTTAASYLTKPIIAVTWEPATSTTDSCATTANQSPLPTGTYPNTETDRTGWNSAVRSTLPSWAFALFDMAAPVEGPSGKWIAGYSIDCVHAGPNGGNAVVRSGVVNVRQFYKQTVVQPVRGASTPDYIRPAQIPPIFTVNSSLGTSASWITVDPLGTSNLTFSRNGYLATMSDSLFGPVYGLYVRNFYGSTDIIAASATTQSSACGSALSGQTNIITSGAASTGVCLQNYPSSGSFSTNVVIINATTTTKLVWPQSGAAIWNLNGSTSAQAANASVSLASGTRATFTCSSASICYMGP